MAQIGLSPERLRQMAQDEERLAEPPAIWPAMPFSEQQSRAKRLQEIEAFRLAKLWRVLAQDNDRVSQRVVIRCGIELLLLDADHVEERAAGPRVRL